MDCTWTRPALPLQPKPTHVCMRTDSKMVRIRTIRTVSVYHVYDLRAPNRVFELVFELVLDLVHSENGHLLYLVTYFLPQSCF